MSFPGFHFLSALSRILFADVHTYAFFMSSGEFCEKSFNDCAREPCADGATCMNDATGFTCLCPDGYTSTLCNETINFCLSNPCFNGGRSESYHKIHRNSLQLSVKSRVYFRCDASVEL